MALLIISLLLIATGILSWHFNFNPFIGYSIGLVLGITLMICLLKKLAQWAIKSLIAWTILTSILSSKITSHLAKNHGYNIKEENKSIPDADYNDFKTALKNLGYLPREVKEAFSYINDNSIKGTLEDKIRLALNYLGNGHKVIEESRR